MRCQPHSNSKRAHFATDGRGRRERSEAFFSAGPRPHLRGPLSFDDFSRTEKHPSWPTNGQCGKGGEDKGPVKERSGREWRSLALVLLHSHAFSFERGDGIKYAQQKCNEIEGYVSTANRAFSSISTRCVSSFPTAPDIILFEHTYLFSRRMPEPKGGWERGREGGGLTDGGFFPPGTHVRVDSRPSVRSSVPNAERRLARFLSISPSLPEAKRRRAEGGRDVGMRGRERGRGREGCPLLRWNKNTPPFSLPIHSDLR